MDNKKLNYSVIGTFSGICADADITNENGLDITRPVWENVFNSDLYKTAIELGHYIGFLGHPDDPNCMDFKDACIVMREGHIEDDGKIYGEFDLIDTPVGRVVKTFIDAGVTFGISVRGAGDIINNSVDPETFVFRGFDLVTFPAYPEAIPEFTDIAAATDSESRLKYQKICASVQSEIDNIDSCGTLNVIKEQFPKQSDMYATIENRQSALLSEIEECDEVIESSIEEQKVNGLVNLYLNEKSKKDELQDKIESMQKRYDSEKIKATRKFNALMRIVADQNRSVEETIAEADKLENKYATVIRANKQLKKELQREKNSNLQYYTKIEANEQLLADRDSKIKHLQKKLSKTVINASIVDDQASQIAEQEATIRSLTEELNKTVIEASQLTERASNLDDKVENLEQQIIASQQLIAEYQDAYASIYAMAVGVDLNNVSVTASTSVADLQKKIVGSSAQLAVSENFVEPQQIDIDDENDNCLITI